MGSEKNPTSASVVETHRPEREDFIAWVCAQIKLCDESEYECVGLPATIEVIQRRRMMFKECLRLAEDHPAILPGEPPCSKESVGNLSSATSGSVSSQPQGPSSESSPASSASPASNPPPWATPAILAACKPGEVLYYDGFDWVGAFPSGLWWWYGELQGKKTVYIEARCKAKRYESYTVPSPTQACDGSGRTVSDGKYIRANVPCPGCDRCRLDVVLSEKIRELCRLAVKAQNYFVEKPGDLSTLAREVLAMMENPCPTK